MLSFNDAEEQIVNKILDSLATMDFQQINFSAESVLSFSNITIYPVSYTHLDVYKRQVLKAAVVDAGYDVTVVQNA